MGSKENSGKRCNGNTERTVNLSMQEWCGLVKKGVAVPITTLLQGSSMEPLIRYRKDPVTIIPLNRKLQMGDIILFERQDGAFVVHRLYHISDDGQTIQTWGDNCYEPDLPVSVSSVLGLVVSLKRNGKRVSLDTQEQRFYGIRWMNSRWRRPLWFTYRRIRSCIGRAVREIFQYK